MAKKDSGFIGTFGGDPKSRLSNVLAGDRTGRGKASKFSAVRQGNYNLAPALGAPVTRMGAYAQRKDLPSGSIDIRGYFGDERTGIRKTAGQKIASALKAGVVDKKAKPADVVRTTTDMKTTPARMAVNRATGDTTGFTTGTTTGSTVTKAGTAYKTPMTGLQRMGQNAFNKGGVAGPSRSTGGASRSAGPSRSTGGTRASNPSRGDVGAGRRGGGR